MANVKELTEQGRTQQFYREDVLSSGLFPVALVSPYFLNNKNRSSIWSSLIPVPHCSHSILYKSLPSSQKWEENWNLPLPIFLQKDLTSILSTPRMEVVPDWLLGKVYFKVMERWRSTQVCTDPDVPSLGGLCPTCLSTALMLCQVKLSVAISYFDDIR